MKIISIAATMSLLLGCATANSGHTVDDQSRPLRFKLYTDESGECRWSLLAANGTIIADSAEGYTRRTECLEAVKRIRRAADAVLDEER
jgi:uncharacterized protein YegP (UPF0339 family)